MPALTFDDIQAPPAVASAKPGPITFDDLPAAPGVAEDVAKAVPSGLVSGTAGLLGAPAGLLDFADKSYQWALSKLLEKTGALTPEQAAGIRKPIEGLEDTQFRMGLPKPGLLQAAADKAAGGLYEPQTLPGQYAKTVAEFAPGAVLGAGSIPQRIAQTVVPAIASETAGQVTKGTEYEPWARLAGAGFGALGTAAAQMPKGAQPLLREALDNFTPQEITAATDLMRTAAARPEPINLTFGEALNQVTGGRAGRVSQIERVAANSQGGQAMTDLYAARPGQVRAAGEAEINALAPNPYPADRAAAATQRAAQGVLDDAEKAINNVTRPDYLAAGRHTLDPADFAPIADNPAFQASLKRLRSDEVLGPKYANLPDNSVAVIDAVTKDMSAQGKALTNSANGGFNPQKAAAFEGGAGEARAIARDPARGGVQAYDDALTVQSQARQQILEPLENGPVGRVSRSDPAGVNASAGQGATLVGAGEDAGRYAPVIADHVGKLVAKDPRAAATAVRDFVGSIFNKATADLKAGPDQFGGAGFRSALVGNTAEGANFRAAVGALPNGAERLSGFDRFLDILEATGYRPAKGSDTAFNQSIQRRIAEGGALSTAIEGAAGAGIGAAAGIPGAGIAGAGLATRRALSDAWTRYRAGNNTSELAAILTDPRSADVLRDLARLPPDSPRAAATAARLLYMGRAATERGQPAVTDGGR